MRRFIRKFRKSFRYGEKGFTLIELLVVVAILGVLAAVAIPAVAKFIGSGESESYQTERANVLVAVTAAMTQSTPAGTTVAIGSSGNEVQLVANSAGPVDDCRTYLLNDTEWKYSVDTNGLVTQSAIGDKA